MNKLCIYSIILYSLSLSSLNLYSKSNDVEIKNNSEKFVKQVIDKCDKYLVIDLKELTPFSWDTVYFFKSYQDTKNLYKKIGFKWSGLRKVLNDSSMQIVFVHNKRVVCYLSGVPKKIYLESSKEKIDFNEMPKFIVTDLNFNENNGIISLKWLEDSIVNKLNQINTPEENKYTGHWVSKNDKQTDNILIKKHLDFVVTTNGTIYGTFVFYIYKGNDDITNLQSGKVLTVLGNIKNNSLKCELLSHDFISVGLLDMFENQDNLIGMISLSGSDDFVNSEMIIYQD